MNCREAEALLDGYVDGELDLVRAVEIEGHLEDCPSCARIRSKHLALRSALRTGGVRYEAPPHLARNVRRSIGGRERPRAWWRWGWAVAAAGAALAILGAWRLSVYRAEDLVAQEVVSSHIRSLMGAHLLDVPSSDQHTVKPWFNGKLDFSPPVKDLAPKGFPLAGGRLDYLDGRAVAALVYQRRKHVINVFLWPSPAQEPRRALAIHGYNILHWSQDGMSWWVASDLNPDELHRFASLLATHDAARARDERVDQSRGITSGADGPPRALSQRRPYSLSGQQ